MDILIEVEDRGVGIPAARFREIQKRISIAYGESYGLCIDSEEGLCTRASLRLPAIPDTQTSSANESMPGQF